MDNLEEILKSKQELIEGLEAPPELRAKLRTALDRPKVRAKGRPWYTKGLAIAALLVLMFTAYSYDALAYYGKRLLGYDQVISGSLKDLNQMGRGQEIGKSYTFSDGTQITLDKIFFDDNELVALYTEKLRGETVQSPNFNRVQTGLKGLIFNYFPYGGGGVSNPAGTQTSWAMSFDPPKVLEKWMDFTVSKSIKGKAEMGKIPFTLDWDKAIVHRVKQNLTQEINVAGKKINFKSITVTPLSTVVQATGENFAAHEHLTFDLVVDDQKVPPQGLGISGKKFEWKFDGINQVHSLKFTNIKIEKETMVDLQLPLNKHTEDLSIGSGENLFKIKKVWVQDGNTYLQIERMSNVEAVFGLFNADLQLSAMNESENVVPSATRIVEETKEFKGTGSSLNIRVKTIKTYTPYSESIEVPLK